MVLGIRIEFILNTTRYAGWHIFWVINPPGADSEKPVAVLCCDVVLYRDNEYLHNIMWLCNQNIFSDAFDFKGFQTPALIMSILWSNSLFSEYNSEAQITEYQERWTWTGETYQSDKLNKHLCSFIVVLRKYEGVEKFSPQKLQACGFAEILKNAVLNSRISLLLAPLKVYKKYGLNKNVRKTQLSSLIAIVDR